MIQKKTGTIVILRGIRSLFIPLVGLNNIRMSADHAIAEQVKQFLDQKSGHSEVDLKMTLRHDFDSGQESQDIIQERIPEYR